MVMVSENLAHSDKDTPVYYMLLGRKTAISNIQALKKR